MTQESRMTLIQNFIVKNLNYDQKLYWLLRNQYGFDDFLATILSSKYLKDDKDIDNFLNPKIRNLMPDPFIMKDMYRGVCAVFEAIKNKHKICIFADYDVDGATSSATLVRFFRELNISVDVYVPDRFKEGYGPNIKALNELKNSKYELIITVDCGVVAFSALKFASEIGLKVIVLDHHLGEEALPIASAVINPNRLDDDSGLNYLCGAGVAFMFACGVTKFIKTIQENKISEFEKYDKKSEFNNYQELCKSFDIKKINLINLLDLVALGTVCDMVPINELNRAFVKTGLDVINNSPSIGISAMIKVKKITQPLSTYELGFVLGPMINAGSRIDKSFFGSKLLSTESKDDALEIATHLAELNEQRKDLQDGIYQKAFEKASLESLSRDKVLFLYDQIWHQGVIGIIAGKIKDCFYLPTIIGSIENDENNNQIIKASCRSILGIDLGGAILKAVSEKILIKGGGHPMAAGFSLELHKVDEFKNFLNNHFGESVSKFSKDKSIIIDYNISIKAINNELLEKIKQFEPFGIGNQELTFMVNDFIIIKSDIINQKHLKLFLSDQARTVFIGAIMFNVENCQDLLQIINKKNISIIANIKENNYNGNVSPQMIIKDFVIEL